MFIPLKVLGLLRINQLLNYRYTMNRLFFPWAVAALVSLAACSKDEPKHPGEIKKEERAKRDWLDGKTFIHISDEGKPVEERMPSDYTIHFYDGKAELEHLFQDGHTKNDHDIVTSKAFGTYTYDSFKGTITMTEGIMTWIKIKGGVETVIHKDKKEIFSPARVGEFVADEVLGTILVRDSEGKELKFRLKK